MNITERKALENARLIEANKTQREKFRALTARLAAAEELERRRLALGLHDQVGQTLTALGINLNVMRDLIVPKKDIQQLHLVNDSLSLVEEAVERTREIISELRPPVLDDYGLLAALKWDAARLAQRSGLSIRVKGDHTLPELPIHVESALFHISQEALLNVAKHAHARKVKVHLGFEKNLVRLTIEDDGQGYEPIRVYDPGMEPTWGLLSIHERAEAIGGQVIIQASQGHGMKITIEVGL